MMQPSKDIVDILEDSSSGVSLVLATNLFINKEPISPVNTVTIYDTEGMGEDLDLGGATGYERPTIQVRIRNTKQSAAWVLAKDIKSRLHGLHQETWNGTLYSLIACSSGPALLEWDDNGNIVLVANFEIQRRSV